MGLLIEGFKKEFFWKMSSPLFPNNDDSSSEDHWLKIQIVPLIPQILPPPAHYFLTHRHLNLTKNEVKENYGEEIVSNFTELMNLCVPATKRKSLLGESQDAQAKGDYLRKIGSTSRVESSINVSLGDQEDASKQGRKIKDLDADAEVTLVDETQEMNDDKPVCLINVYWKELQKEVDGQGEAKDKGKAIMVEPERPLKKKDQVNLDEENG
ncbi:hypothetical protein Tco_0918968 [Tanacetum coccineum]